VSHRTYLHLFVCFVMAAPVLTGCAGRTARQAAPPAVYHVLPCAVPPVIDANWNKEIWRQTAAIRLRHHMGTSPGHFPDTQVKMRYDKDALYVIFRVADQYVRAVATELHGKVWQDSCVEFFFTPGEDSTKSYVNLETNCKGVFLLQYHQLARHQAGLIGKADCARVDIAHSLKEDARQELRKPVVWTLEYRLPLDILSKYVEVAKPGKKTRWRANFYKCGDLTSHPHWLTWAEVDAPKPNFHLPEFFGWLEFE